MKVIRSGEGLPYEAARHFGCWSARKVGPAEGAQRVSVSVSEFLPNGGAEMSSSDKERVYYVLRGELVVKDGSGNRHVLRQDDMIYIPPGEKREIAVEGQTAARILVIMADV